ncbi:Ferrous iron transport protein B [Calycomorphotria hydatis]|uniref:Ferrous iron transport protein B n=1 Tax=Calycomorphotria hydatis TaxID=2528027 RepID=A0A517T4Z9_9PLAN|nr:Ferrous iron transport protein B [Calycomorphotria hydatis]
MALIGNPNTGKSTLFNALSGMRAHVGNFPGCTVEKKVANTRFHDRPVQLIDLPGTYSLSARTADEMVSVNVLLDRQSGVADVDVIVCVVDASNLERNLYLFSQLRDLDKPVVLVLNMADTAKANGITIDREQLQERLGIPVVFTEAHRHRGLDEMKSAVTSAADSGSPAPLSVLPEPFNNMVEELKSYCAEQAPDKEWPVFLIERLLLDVGGETERRLTKTIPGIESRLTESRTQLQEQNCPVPSIEPVCRYRWIRESLQDIVTREEVSRISFSDRVDQVLTHRVWGLAFFAALMFGVFYAIYSGAGPFMDGIETLQGMISDFVASILPPGAFRSLLVDGIIAGVGSVVIFVPQIAILFLFIAIMEDCGYMARAAFLMDKLMTKIGLSGKSFLPLMSSYACAIPGVMATRVIENPRDRMVTILVAPLMSCSARLPVYVLMIGLFIETPWRQALSMFAMYSLGLVVAIPVAWILKKTWFKGEPAPFVMELPNYKQPSPRIVFARVYDRVLAFIKRAGTMIFATTILVWAAGYFPGDREETHQIEAQLESESLTESETGELEDRLNQLNGTLMEQSILGRAGHLVEPVVRPLGWDWRIGVGVLASFPAREVIVATLGTIYSLGGEVGEDDESLRSALLTSKWPDGTPVYNIPVAFSIMVFFALCAQCVSTLAVIYRETNSYFWPAFSFVYMTVLAYIGALITYQVGMLIV